MLNFFYYNIFVITYFKYKKFHQQVVYIIFFVYLTKVFCVSSMTFFLITIFSFFFFFHNTIFSITNLFFSNFVFCRLTIYMENCRDFFKTNYERKPPWSQFSQCKTLKCILELELWPSLFCRLSWGKLIGWLAARYIIWMIYSGSCLFEMIVSMNWAHWRYSLS